MDVFRDGTCLLLDCWDNSTRPAADSKEGNLVPIGKHGRLILFALAPSMFEQPMLGKFLRIREDIDGGSADIVNCGVKLLDLIIRQGVAVLLWVDPSVIKDFVPRELLMACIA